MKGSSTENTGPKDGWVKPVIRTFDSPVQLERDLPWIYTELQARGLIVDGGFCWKEQ